MPESFLPFLHDDARVRTGRALYAEPAPDLDRNGTPEVLESDMRYRYEIAEGQQALPTVESDVDTRIVVRNGRNGRKLWTKRYDTDAYPFSMRVGHKGQHGVVVISGFWNFYGTTEQSTLRFDAFDRRGKHLWSREYTSVSYYELLTYVREDGPVVVASFDGVKGRAEDLMLGLATSADAMFTRTTATRVVVIDGRDGSEKAHPIVDVGIDWWPIPLPTKDLDGDGLDDYATTNKFGVDPGDSEAQQGPSIGGTVYTRKGTDGTPIWTTSGLRMAVFGWTDALPDVVGDRTPEVGLSTYVESKTELPLPIDVPLLPLFDYRPRVYLFDGDFGAKVWHRPYEWLYSPGDIDGNGRADLLLLRWFWWPRRHKSSLHMRGVNGMGDRLWETRSTWRYETMPCPRGACFASFGMWFDGSPDFQPDGVDDVLQGQVVEQNAAFTDSITRTFDGRTGRTRFEDNSNRRFNSAGVAIDGRGTDLLAFEYGDNEIHVTARNGNNRVLWGGTLAGPEKLLPRNSGFWGTGFVLPGDRCGDPIINGWHGNDYYYGVFDGGSGRVLWSRWTGSKQERPRFSERTDRNRRC